jgi:hypothetical protein
MDPATIVTVSIVTAKASALLALWLRLRWQAHREEDRHHYLLGITDKMVAGDHAELYDQHRDGHRLHVTILRTAVHEEDQTR